MRPLISGTVTVCYDETHFSHCFYPEHSGSMVEFLTRDQGATGSSLTDLCCVTCVLDQDTFILVQPRKTHSHISERLLSARLIKISVNRSIYI